MNNLKALLFTAALAIASAAFAQTQDTQTVEVKIGTAEQLQVTESKNVSRSINDFDTLRKGNLSFELPTQLTFTTNADALRKISAQAAYSMPQGTRFIASIPAQGNVSDKGGSWIFNGGDLSEKAVDLVNNIKNVSDATANFTLQLNLPDTPIVTGSYRVEITYTLMGY